jgi:membrane protease YdiL (CAAX protease family)
MPAPFSLRLALSWTVLATAALWFGLGAVFFAFPRASQSIVLLGAVQVVVYALLLALFQAARGTPFEELLALRRASLAICVAAAALGFLLQIPATLISNAVEHFFPTPAAVLAERIARVTPHSRAQAVAIFLVVAGMGPCVEEFFFRGALFGALRRGHGALVTGVFVALCFALGHVDARLFVPLFGAALALGDVREHSGSIWPGIALHGAFNAATLGLVFSGSAPEGKPPAMPIFVAVFGCVGSLALVFALRVLALSSRVAQNARSSEQRYPS